MNETEVCDVFSEAGTIECLRLCRCATTRRRLGYGYIGYNRREDAERAIAMLDSTELTPGQPCRVRWCQGDPNARDSGFSSVIVKNLPTTVDETRFYDEFSRFGNIASCKVCVDAEGKSVGHGFVHFETKQIANKAVEAAKNGELIIDHARVLVRINTPTKHGITDKLVRVYVKNLPPSWDKAKLDEYFSQFGTITSCVVAYDQATKESRGFGFVHFATHEEATAAIEGATGHIIGEGAAATTLYACHALKRAERELWMQWQYEQARLAELLDLASCIVYLRRLPEKMTLEWLCDIFGKFGTITYALYSYVFYETRDEAAKAVAEMNGTMIDGKPIWAVIRHTSDHGAEMLSRVQKALHVGFPLSQHNDFKELFTYPTKMQKHFLTKALYPLVKKALPENSDKAHKITDMLLEMPSPEVLDVIMSEEELRSKVNDALAALTDTSDDAHAFGTV